MRKKICVITPNYPINGFIERGAFVANLVNEWINYGINVDVIAPISISLYLKTFKNRDKNFKQPPATNLYEPIFFAFSNYFVNFSKKSFVYRTIKIASKIEKPDFYYAKFLSYAGKSASILSGKFNIPAFVDIGESRLLDEMTKTEIEDSKEIISNLSGAIVVSQRLKNEIIELGMKEENILLAPNGVDKNKFKPMNMIKCREKLNLPKDKFIIIFVGHFIERKGPIRLLKALEKLNNDDIKVIFIGKGKLPPSKYILKSLSVHNSELPYWLNSANIFVLPTLAEGNCNAINEAMACGLPIVTSNIDDVKYQVKDSAILIDPLNIDEISSAIEFLYKNQATCEKLGKRARNNVYDISERAENILRFIYDKI